MRRVSMKLACLLATGLAPLTALADGLPPSFPDQNLITENDAFRAPEGTTEMPVILSHIGMILPNDEKAQEGLKILADRFQLEIVIVYQDELAFLQVPRDVTQKDLLAAFVADIRPAAAEFGIKVGLTYDDPAPGDIPALSTNEIIGVAQDGETDAMVRRMEDQGFTLLMAHPYLKGYAVFASKESDAVDMMDAARKAAALPEVGFAYPNFTGLSWDAETLLNDPQFANQWHLRNTGQAGGTTDADADLSDAWDISQGAANVIIAIHENGGYDTTHPDLLPNIWANPGETAGNGVDDDGNGWVDDMLGWDFAGCSAATSPGCGDNAPTPADATENHGTAVAGVAAAAGGNNLGVTGSCPNCTLMLLRSGYTANDFAKSLPFGYAQAQGALVVSNSWSSGNTYPTTTAAINAAATAGVSVLFAAGNTAANNCTDPRVGNNASVLAVSSASNQDRKVVISSVGPCIDILSPSHRGYTAADPYTGTLNVTTTDRQGNAGYNNANPVNNCPTTQGSPPPANARDYTACFGGTSSATPLTAGVVGLIETVNTTITRTQIQNLLADTADRIEDSVGAYADTNGFSAPAGGATHSWGRMNAFEALQIAAPVAQGGQAGVDVFIRDNRLDWGNTIQPSNTLFDATRGFIPHWRSVDIKVDAPPYVAAPPTNSAEFDAYSDEDPVESSVNRVYVRVRNRGPVTASEVTVKFHWAFAGTALPALPSDFWTAFPADSADTTIWHPEPPQTISNLAYSGASVAGTAGDNAQILTFDFDAPAVDPAASNPRHYCVMVVLDSPQDTIDETTLIVDLATPRNNNMTHRNLSLQDSDADGFRDFIMVRNPYREPIRTMLMVDAPDGWKIDSGKITIGRPFSLDPGQEVAVPVVAVPPRAGLAGEVSFIQLDLSHKDRRVMGGFDVVFRGKGDREIKQLDPAMVNRLEVIVPQLERELDRLELLLPQLEQISR